MTNNPCPWCESEEIQVGNNETKECYPTLFFGMCGACGACGPLYTAEVAITETQKQAAGIEAMKLWNEISGNLKTETKDKRRIIQIATSPVKETSYLHPGTFLIALCEDGSIWQKWIGIDTPNGEWVLINGISAIGDVNDQ